MRSLKGGTDVTSGRGSQGSTDAGGESMRGGMESLWITDRARPWREPGYTRCPSSLWAHVYSLCCSLEFSVVGCVNALGRCSF